MEYIRMRDSSSSPHPNENPAVSLIEADPLTPNRSSEPNAKYPSWSSLPSSTTNFQYEDGSPPEPNPLFRGFERPNFSRVAILAALCLITYPVFYILTLVAKDKSLFIVRVLVSMWCSGVGFALGYILLTIGAQHLEAATWATVMHMSHEGGGMKLRDLARSSRNPTSFMPAIHIFRSRLRNGGTARRARKSYDKRPWSLFIGFFVVLAILVPLLPFILGRIMEIKTFVHSQREIYREVLIAGDLSQEDVDRAAAQLGAWVPFAQTWALLPYGKNPPETAELPIYGNDTVYFAQPSLSQFVPGGSGAGTYNINQTVPINLKDSPSGFPSPENRSTPESDTGVVLRYPQWGIRIRCKKLPDPEVNLIPSSSQNSTYIFIPQNFLRALFGTYGVDLPTALTKPDLVYLDVNDTIPSNIDPSTISYLVKMWNNGVSHSFHTRTVLDADVIGNGGWTTIETVLIRLNTSYTPSGRFPVYSNGSSPDINGVETRIGYDSAVCVQKYEPWIIETYNTSIGSPSVLRIVQKEYGGPRPSPSGSIQGAPIANTRNLNTTGKNPAFYLAHDNSINQVVKDNGRDYFYAPSLTAVSFTEGGGPEGYIELSPDRFAVFRARANAAEVLPYLAGSGHIVAQSYADETLAYVTYQQWQLISLPILILILGIIGELFVPTLPFDIPRREFGAYSWLALFQSQELQFEAADDLDKFVSLDKLEERFSGKRVKFIV